MISIESEQKSLEEWALDELKLVGQRGFEFSKFFFGASVGAFAIFPFFKTEFSAASPLQIIGMVSLGYSIFIAIKMADPVDFTITDKIVLADEHAKYVKRIKRQRRNWLYSWLAGVLFVLLGMALEFDIGK